MAAPPRPSPPSERRPRWLSLLWWAGLVAILAWVAQSAYLDDKVVEIPYSEFKTKLAQGRIQQVAVAPDTIIGSLKPDDAQTTESKTSDFRTTRVEDPELIKQLEAAQVEVTGKTPNTLWMSLAVWLFPLGFLLLMWGMAARRMRGVAGEALRFGKSPASFSAHASTGVTFEDVAGCDEAKLELQEIVTFLSAPDQYKRLGAKIPKGVLLVGPPGTGKTLMARAVAGEAKVPFFSLSGSDFVEMFAGVGAARVRDLFEQAKRSAPCIVFIDELDAIGRRRGVHLGVVNDEREQTLNALLVELDGFEPNSGVILLSATNRPDVLDPALLRPGRFDRQVVMDAPDVEGRLAILKIHIRGKPLEDEVDLRAIAQGSPGFAGADLANAVNEAALLAARRGADRIAQADLESAFEKVVAGPERRTRRLAADQRRRVAIHEIGHALVAHLLDHTDPIRKISIIPRGRAALGYTLQIPTEDQFVITQSELQDRLAVLLGGRCAEVLALGEASSGAEDDLMKATALARHMVAVLGMSDVIGLARCAHNEPSFGGAFTPEVSGVRDCSEQTAREVDEEVKRLLDQAKAKATTILTEHRDALIRVATALLERESLDREAFVELVGLPAARDNNGASP